MALDIVRAVEDSVEFFTAVETGDSGMSVSGIARLCDVTHQKVSRLLKNLAESKGPKRLKRFEGKALDLAAFIKRGGKTRIIRAEVCAAIIMHFAFEGSEKAQIALEKFSSNGVNTWIQSITGWSQKKADVSRYLTGVVLIEPKTWEVHFNADWASEASRLTGWAWQWSCMGHFINEVVYDYMPTEVRAELDRVNPIGQNGKRKSKQHQHFSDEAKPILKAHITEVFTLMQASTSRPEFDELMNRRWNGRYQLSLKMS